MSIRNPRALTVASLFAIFVGGTGGALTQLGPWYYNLQKPWWQPPDWLFGPAWTVIFAFTAAAGYRAWLDSRYRGDRIKILVLFVVNSLLNIAWSWLFFTSERPDWALIEVSLLWVSIVALILVIRRFSKTAAWLLAPYLAWVSFASFLNWTVVQLNQPFGT